MKRGRTAACAIVASAAGAAFVLTVPAASCGYGSDFTAFPCAIPAYVDARADAARDAGDGGDDAIPNGDFIPTFTAARLAALGACALDGSPLPADVITLISCDNAVYAFYRASDGGPVVVDYYNESTNAFLARVTFSDTASNGVCAIGNGAFLPPNCSGASYICCGSDAGDAGDGGVLGDGGDAAINEAGCGTF